MKINFQKILVIIIVVTFFYYLVVPLLNQLFEFKQKNVIDKKQQNKIVKPYVIDYEPQKSVMRIVIEGKKELETIKQDENVSFKESIVHLNKINGCMTFKNKCTCFDVENKKIQMSETECLKANQEIN